MKSNHTSTVNDRALELGREVFEEVHAATSSKLSTEYWGEQLMQWAMGSKEFKVSIFRFVGVFPDLDTAESVVRHAQEYFTPVADQLPALLRNCLGVEPKSLTATLGSQLIRRQIGEVARRFIVGETPKKAIRRLKKLRNRGLAFTIDLLGEATVSEKESLEYRDKYLDLLHELQKQWSNASPLIEDHKGEQTPINISVKLSALYSQSKPVSTEKSVEILTERLHPILTAAKNAGAYVYLDMEHSAYTSIIIDTFKRILSLPEFSNYERVGIVLQAYLRRTEADVYDLLAWAEERGCPIGVRLVKGAYWDTESALARQRGWPNPVWEIKRNSDATYERISTLLLRNTQLIYPAFASHNTRSLCHAIATAEALGVSKNDYELQMLYGMAEPIKQAFLQRGFLVRDYAPIGELVPGMGYLVRRLLENTSNEGFLRLSFHEGETAENLLAEPLFDANDTGESHLNSADRGTFENVPFQDFSLPKVRLSFKARLDEEIKRLKSKPEEVLPIIGGEKRPSSERIPSLCPDDQDFCLANISLADEQLGEEALKDLKDYFPIWRQTSTQERVDLLQRVADLMKEDRNALASLIVLEASKQWVEADADVAEAIDFLRYYAAQASELFAPTKLGDYPGEWNTLTYEARGVAVVISPWNFPLAIACGMFSAALVCGNTVILKPAEQTSLIAQKLFELFLRAGLPPHAAAFLPGRGESLGAFLVKHKDISTIAFTGSKEVGLEIIQKAAETKPGQEHVKKVIAEMGGKNAIIIDDDADLDEAVKGVTYSAFGFQGQKCSACSRVIVVGEATFQRFSERFAEATKSIEVGPAWEPSSFLSSVADRHQFERISHLIEEARRSLRVLAEGRAAPEGGLYIQPTVFTDIPEEGHSLLKTEVFGPVATLEFATTFDEALKKALNSEYALTGAVYSRSPRNIESAISEFRVGNLYINRGSTGALVYRQPFGGAKMSGVGSKAGGPDYLLQFVIPRAVTENTMRRGFTPDLEQ